MAEYSRLRFGAKTVFVAIAVAIAEMLIRMN